MARKEFHFDFNEEADPVDELHRLRVATTKHFKTMQEHLAYLRATPTAEEFLAQLDAEIAEKKAKAKPSSRPTSQRRKTPAHA